MLNAAVGGAKNETEEEDGEDAGAGTVERCETAGEVEDADNEFEGGRGGSEEEAGVSDGEENAEEEEEEG